LLSVCLVSVRKTFQGEILEERIIGQTKDDPREMIHDLGVILAKSLIRDPDFIEFCKTYPQNDLA
jgi:hypothetical protein